MRTQKHIVITGGSGFIGKALAELCIQENYKVTSIDRYLPEYKIEHVSYIMHDIAKPWDPAWIDDVDAVVHLAGSSIFGRWTKSFMDAIYTSRIEGTKQLVRTIGLCEHPPRVLVGASAIGYYGDTGILCVDENFSSGKDFLARVCIDWEKELFSATQLNVRVVALRTAHVLGQGGFLGQLFDLFRIGLGTWFGQGLNRMSWVHSDDMIRAYLFAVQENSIAGAYNVSAHECVSQKTFMQTLASAFSKKICLSIPIWLVRLRYKGFADTLTMSQCVTSEKIRISGFEFHYDTLEFALTEIVQTHLLHQKNYEKK